MSYFGIAIFCTGIFIIQFILSFILGELDLDSDIDLDSDGDIDFSLSDVLSFKGLCHFGIGFGWTMWFSKGENQFISACIAVLVGIIFMFVLYGIYVLAYKLEHKVTPEEGEDLVGRKVTIYLKLKEGNLYTASVTKNSSYQEITVESIGGKDYKPGEQTNIVKYENGIYYIL